MAQLQLCRFALGQGEVGRLAIIAGCCQAIYSVSKEIGSKALSLSLENEMIPKNRGRSP
jgi:hypothetical protein